MVCGTRTTRELVWEQANMGWFLRIGNWAVAKMLQLLHDGPSLSDCGCTLRLTHRKALEKIQDDLTVGASHFLPEMVILGLRKKLSIIEVPVNYRGRVGESKITGSLKGTLAHGIPDDRTDRALPIRVTAPHPTEDRRQVALSLRRSSCSPRACPTFPRSTTTFSRTTSASSSSWRAAAGRCFSSGSRCRGPKTSGCIRRMKCVLLSRCRTWSRRGGARPRRSPITRSTSRFMPRMVFSSCRWRARWPVSDALPRHWPRWSSCCFLCKPRASRGSRAGWIRCPPCSISPRSLPTRGGVLAPRRRTGGR